MSVKSIQVLGSGCPTCKQLLENTKKVASELGIKVEVEYITDISKMIELGVMTSPVVTVNGKVVIAGGRISEEDIKKALLNNPEPAKGCCSCGSC